MMSAMSVKKSRPGPWWSIPWPSTQTVGGDIDLDFQGQRSFKAIFSHIDPQNRHNSSNVGEKVVPDPDEAPACTTCLHNYTDSRWYWPWVSRLKSIFRLFVGTLTPKSTTFRQCMRKSRLGSWQSICLNNYTHWRTVGDIDLDFQGERSFAGHFPAFDP